MASALKFLVKCSIGGGAIYLTTTQDIWSSQDKSLIAAKRMRSHITENVPFEVVPLPELPEPEKVKGRWNSGVDSMFKSLHDMPETLSECGGDAVTTVKNFIKDKTH